MHIIQFFFFIYLIFHVSFAHESDFSEVFFTQFSPDEMSSNYFFLTASKNPSDEIEEFNHLYKKDKSIRCAYPLRASLYTNDFHSADLEQCADLQRFLKAFKRKYVSIGFASEINGIPQSSFGHTFLVFHNELEPELSSRVVHFSAYSEQKKGLLSHIWAGINGHYRAKFFSNSLSDKFFEYLFIEQRVLHLFRLNLNNAEVVNILHFLYESQFIDFPYYFFSNNCSSVINTLISAPNAQLASPSSILYTLPVETIYALEPHFAEHLVYVPPKMVYDTTKDKSKSDVIRASYNYLFRKLKDAPNDYSERMLKLPIEKSIFTPSRKQVGRPHLPRRFELSITDNSKVFWDYRPLLKSFEDNFYLLTYEDTLEIFRTKIRADTKSISLDSFTLLRIGHITPLNSIRKEISWEFATVIDDQNFKENLSPSIYFALGGYYFYQPFFKVGLLISSSANLEHTSSLSYIGPILRLLYYPTDRLKLDSRVFQKFYRSKNQTTYTTAMTYFISSSFNVFFKYENEKDAEYSLGIAYSF